MNRATTRKRAQRAINRSAVRLQPSPRTEEREAPWYDNPNPPRALEYRLRAYLYPLTGERYIELPGALFYSGLWASLHTPAARHLYLSIASLDPIRDEAAFPLTDQQIAAHGSSRGALDAIRDGHPMPITVLARATGLQRNTVKAALFELTRPRRIPNADHRVAPVRWNMTPSDDAPQWYAINREALTVPWYRTVARKAA